MPNEISTMSVLFHTENPSLSIHVIAWVIKTKVLNSLTDTKQDYTTWNLKHPHLEAFYALVILPVRGIF